MNARGKNLKGEKGFTLMETLLAASLFVIVISACYSVFTLGIQVWRRTQGSVLTERRAILALEKMTLDIQNTLKLPEKKKDVISLGKAPLHFAGDGTGFTIPSVVTFVTPSGEALTQIGRIGYRWDSSARQFLKTVETATDLYKKSGPRIQILSGSVTKVKFRYWLYRSLSKSYSWYDRWDSEDGLPQAIEAILDLELKTERDRAAADRHFQRTIILPVGTAS